MAYNNGFPLTYPQMYQSPYQYQQAMQYQAPQAQQQPSRMVEVFPVDDEAAVPSFPVSNGGTQMLIHKGDAFIAVKAVGLDGTPSVTFYDKRPPAPVPPPVDFGAYVTREEFETRLAALSAPTRRTTKKEEETA